MEKERRGTSRGTASLMGSAITATNQIIRKINAESSIQISSQRKDEMAKSAPSFP